MAQLIMAPRRFRRLRPDKDLVRIFAAFMVFALGYALLILAVAHPLHSFNLNF